MATAWVFLAMCLLSVNAASLTRQKRQAACEAEEWRAHGDKEYSFISHKRTFAESEAFCRHCGASLASVHDDEELQFVRSLNVDNKPFWLGATDRDAEGQWTWVDGSPLDFVGWRKGEPDNVGSSGEEGANCAYVNHDGDWRDHLCTNTKRFVCTRPTEDTLTTDSPLPDNDDESPEPFPTPIYLPFPEPETTRK